MSLKDQIISALNRVDMVEALQYALLAHREHVGVRRSWDSPEFTTSRKVQESIVQDQSRDDRLTFFGFETLLDRYFLKDRRGNICECPQDFFARVATGVACAHKSNKVIERSAFESTCAYAQELYDILSLQHAMFATPVLTNAGTSRGQLISCFLSAADDSINGIYKELLPENSALAAGGGGIGSYFGYVREEGASIRGGGSATGPIPFIKSFDSQTYAVKQQSTGRSGSGAVYMQVSHPDIEDFLNIRRPKGAVERQCLNVHHGVVIDDAFMKAVEGHKPYNLISPKNGKVVKTIDAYELWKKIVITRVETGEPYILFIDTVNRMQPEVNKKLGFKVLTSNLCIEIMLIVFAMGKVVAQKFWDHLRGRPTPSGRTAVCCLGSLNYARYDEWASYEERLVYLMSKGLDNVLDNFITTAGPDYARATHSASRGRDIGLGVMGWFDYIQKLGIPFESVEARVHNKLRFRDFGKYTKMATERLALERGPAPDAILASPLLARITVPAVIALKLVGTKLGSWVIKKVMPPEHLVRNVNYSAVAPTASIGFIAGANAASVEPPLSNSFIQKSLTGRVKMQNPYLKDLLAKKYPLMNTPETWSSIHATGGSVQHLAFLSDDDRKVFRTGSEINQREIVQQAADRQPYITQGQSLNLFFGYNTNGQYSAKYLHDVHMLAWKAGVKGLYYFRGEAKAQSTNISSNADNHTQTNIQDRLAYEECAVCQ